MFTRQQAEELLNEALENRSELEDAECKSGTGDALDRAICAMANRHDRNGGIVFVGIGSSFQILGVENIESTQTRCVDLASDLFNVPLRVSPWNPKLFRARIHSKV